MNKKIVMLSTSSLGGMLSVIEGYQRDGVFERWNIEFVSTHFDGTAPQKIWVFLKAFAYVFMLLAKGRVTLLHCHMAMKGSFVRKLALASLGRCFGIPVILHLHGSETQQFYNSLPAFVKGIVSRQLTAAATVFVLSESWRSFVLKVAPKAQVIVLPNYVELPELADKRSADTKINVLFLGLVGKRKGIYDLLPAFAAAVKTVPQLFLRIGGNGEVEKAKALVDELGLQAHVECLDWVSGAAKNELLRDADIFVLPSYNEGLPVSILEAMSWGLPVITTAVGGIPELIKDQVNGLLISPGDVAALQNRLEQLGGDADSRHRIGIAARESVEKEYSKEVILPILTSVYERYTHAQ